LNKFELLFKKSDAIVLLDRINSETSKPSQGQSSPQASPAQANPAQANQGQQRPLPLGMIASSL
jgi:hypothetical protein